MKTSFAGFGLLVAAALCACSEGSGTLAVTVDSLPKFVRDSSVLVTGTVMRTPAKATDIIVTVSGGAAAAADTFRGNQYTVRVRLTLNTANPLTISASDATGSTANSLNVSVRQDGTGPTVTQVTPADTSDNVAVAAPITVKFSEPVVLGTGGGIGLTRQGVVIAGTTTRSADSLTLTFAPATPLSPNAIYQLALAGVSDLAQNSVSANAGTCFVTTTAGASAVATFPDSTNDNFHGPPGVPPSSSGLLQPDLVAARFAREGSLLTGVLRFIGPRVFSGTALNQGSALVDFDIDEDSITGFKPIKDQLFEPSLTLGPTYSSGMGAEYILGLEPHPQLGDSAYFGGYVSTEEFQPLALFLPGSCGAFMGFVIPFSTQLLNDDGKMNVLVLGIAANAVEIFVDPIPTKKNLPVDLRVPGPAPLYGISPFVTHVAAPRVLRLLPRHIPLR